jgi:hypothetical protein
MIHHHGSIDREEMSKTQGGSSPEVAGIVVGGRRVEAARKGGSDRVLAARVDVGDQLRSIGG